MPRQPHKNIIFENVEVVSAGAKGKAIAKSPDGRVIFINNAVPGDVVTLRVLKKRKSYYEATATAFHKFSPYRAAPRCKHFGVCGGCQWQHMDYAYQLQYKRQEALDHLTRIGKVDYNEPMAILPSPDVYGYRNKMVFTFSDNRWLTEAEIALREDIKERRAMGLHIPGRWDKALDLSECHLHSAYSEGLREKIKALAFEMNIHLYNAKTREGLLRNVTLRTASGGQAMAIFIFAAAHPMAEELLDRVLKSFPEMTSLFYAINPKPNDAVFDLPMRCYHGQPHIVEQMGTLRFKIGPKSFSQTNSEQAYNLYQKALDLAALEGGELVYDLYTGAGTIALFLAQKAARVVGIESVREAIDDAMENQLYNGISNVDFVVGDMKDVFTEAFVAEHGTPQVVVTDPPREGMHQKVVEQLLKVAPEKIVYISCNSATQARDIERMSSRYKVDKIVAVDMFPQTAHVETVALLRIKPEIE